MSEINLSNYLTVCEAIELTGMPKSTITKFLRENKITGRCPENKIWIIDKKNLLDFVKKGYNKRLKARKKLRIEDTTELIYNRVDKISVFMKKYTRIKTQVLEKQKLLKSVKSRDRKIFLREAIEMAKNDIKSLLKEFEEYLICLGTGKNELTNIAKMLDNICENEIHNKGKK